MELETGIGMQKILDQERRGLSSGFLGRKPIKVELENNSSLCYSEFVRQKPIQFTSV